MEREKFKKNVKEFAKIYKVYSDKNVNVCGVYEDKTIQEQWNLELGYDKNTDYLEVEIFTEIPNEILMSLYSIVQSFVQICETHALKNDFVKNDKEFLNGAKCIDNIIKHKNKNFEITDIIKPDFKCEYYGEDLEVFLKDGKYRISSDDMQFRMGANWVEIKNDIKNEMKIKKWFEFYDKYFEGNDVYDSVIEMCRIVGDYEN